MSSALRLEFDAIRQDQLRIRGSVADLDRRIDLLARRFDSESAPIIPPLPSAAPKPVADLIPPAMPTPRRPEPSRPAPAAPVAPIVSESAPPPLPPKPAPPVTPAAEKPQESWEVMFGTVWLARIGIVILITGLVFLGNYARQYIIAQLGPAGKLGLLYLAGGLLAGAGYFIERSREAMRNYGRVLMAGGAATIYYATYAAHFVETLRVIESPMIAGLLLLGLAGGFIWWAERRRSQTVALLAVLLAYYTSAINVIGTFTLFSSLLLTAVAVFFVVRHRWSTLGWVSILGTYGSYLFWRFHHFANAAAHAPASGETPWMLGVLFLAGYWILFSGGLLIGKGEGLAATRPALFATANNGAFFSLAAIHVAQNRPGDFWLFALLFGAALTGLAYAARARRPDLPSLDSAFLAQGIAFITLGLISKLTGYQLALTLAVQSAFVLTGANRRHGWLLQLAAGIIAAIACGVAWERTLKVDTASSIAMAGCVSVILLFDGWWLKQRLGKLTSVEWSWRAAWFVALGLGLAGVVIERHASDAMVPVAFVLIALIMTALARSSALPELLLGQALLAASVVLVIMDAHTAHALPFSTACTVFVALLAAEQWWQREPELPVAHDARGILQFAASAGAMAVAYHWCEPLRAEGSWILIASGLAFATLVYGIFTRAWATMITGQIFNLFAAVAFVQAVSWGNVRGAVALAPVFTLAATSIVLQHVAKSRFGSVLPSWLPLREITLVYRVLATAALGVWALRYIPNEWLTPFYAAVGAVMVLVASRFRIREQANIGMLYLLAALAASLFRIPETATWIEFAAIALMPASMRLARKIVPEAVISEQTRQFITGAATATAFVWLTRWTIQVHGSAGLTVAWSAFALVVFATGLILRERIYRLSGFGILALAIGRIFLFDVWRLETLYRILSFLVLGVVLLLLGFIYNRYADRIRQWL